MVERWFPKPKVGGSSPSSPESLIKLFHFVGEMAEWSIALIC